MLDSIVNGLEGSLGKRTYLCGNPDCGTLIIFHTKEPRPIVCLRCGSEIDWEGEYITTIRICPKCNKEYDVTANYCPFHSPPVSLIEKEIEK
jgi:predicted amidophosphoribosyltransferase